MSAEKPEGAEVAVVTVAGSAAALDVQAFISTPLPAGMRLAALVDDLQRKLPASQPTATAAERHARVEANREAAAAAKARSAHQAKLCLMVFFASSHQAN